MTTPELILCLIVTAAILVFPYAGRTGDALGRSLERIFKRDSSPK